jgi:uncharacterized SAM-dependent methyltransferase
MKYFRNAELTRLYNVSDKAVRNWIENAQKGKNGLDLLEYKGKTYIGDSLHNELLLGELAQSGKKYRNKRSFKKLTPLPKFYDLYSHTQAIDIIDHLDKYREAPLQYCYVREAAEYWNSYLNKLYAISNSYVTSTVDLLRLDREYLNRLLENYDNVNIVDVGVGNGLAVKALLDHVLSTGKLRRYVGVDISPDLLDITEQNLRKWFGSSVLVEKYVRDITHQRFAEILTTNSYGQDATSTLNVVLFLGGTISNFKEPGQVLRTIRDSLGKNDVLITTVRLDSKRSRRFFDYNIKADKDILTLQDRWMLDLLSIDEPFYDVEQFFDERQMSRFVQVRLKFDISINFKLDAYLKTVEMYKGESILLVRMLHFNDKEIMRLYDESNFDQLRSAKTPNQEYLLLVSQVKADHHRSSPADTNS